VRHSHVAKWPRAISSTLNYAVRRLGLLPENAELIGLVRQKLAVAATRRWIFPKIVWPHSGGRWGRNCSRCCGQKILRKFDLERAFQAVATMAAKVT